MGANRRQEAAAETRRRLVKAAGRILAHKGIDEITVSEIAREAGVATGTFYIYFKKKEDIVTAIPRPEFLHLPEIVNGNAGADTRERLEDYSVQFLSIIEESGIGLCREWVRSYISGEPMDGSEGDTKWEFDLAAVRRVLEEGVRRGEIPTDAPIDEIALAVNAGLYGLMVAWCMSDGKLVGSERAPVLLDMVLPGLLGTPGR